MLPQEVIRATRDGVTLSVEQIEAFVRGIVDGSVTEGQAAAWAMAIYFRGMSVDERVALTRAMATSGTVMHWDLPGPVLDKHSTGGVGDTVSLMLAPTVAACGAFVPMISGRGLGHTGGTFDKMASIGGYDATPSRATFRRVVRTVGCAIIGQTPDLAPADGRLYAIRDVTATVESIPLITASILSKKIAAGLDGLVMDVKAGNGAFMPTVQKARQLADSIGSVAAGAGVRCAALITDMDRPLADVAGNALEVDYAVQYLTGTRREQRMHELIVALGARMLLIGRVVRGEAQARRLVERAVESGEAAERFARMVAALGGPRDILSAPWRRMQRAPVVMEVAPPRPGRVSAIDTRALGLVVVALGGGRRAPSDTIDPAVGLSSLATLGDTVGRDRPLAVVHARTGAAAEQAADALRRAYRIGNRAPASSGVVRDALTYAARR